MRQTIHLRSVVLLAAILAAFMFVPSIALAQSGTYVFDESNLLTNEEFNELEAKGAEYASKYNMGVYFLSCNNMNGGDDSASGRNEFAQSYYHSHNLGVGEGEGDGIMFVVADGTRKYVSFKHIEPGHSDPFSNDGVKSMESDAKEYLSDSEWGKAAESYYDSVGTQLEYFAKNGKAWHKPNTIGFILKVVFSLVLPALIAFAVVQSQKSAMKTARMQTNATNFTSPDDLELTVSNDVFVNTTMSVTPKPKERDSDSGGGGWSSMGGGDSGSGGGSF